MLKGYGSVISLGELIFDQNFNSFNLVEVDIMFSGFVRWGCDDINAADTRRSHTRPPRFTARGIMILGGREHSFVC